MTCFSAILHEIRGHFRLKEGGPGCYLSTHSYDSTSREWPPHAVGRSRSDKRYDDSPDCQENGLLAYEQV